MTGSDSGKEAPVGGTQASYNTWLKQMMDTMLEAEQKWLELAVQQNTLALKALQGDASLFRTPQTPPLTEWARRGVERFMETQRRWFDIATPPRAEGAAQMATMANMPAGQINDFARQQVEGLIETRKRWLDFVNEQNNLFLKSIQEAMHMEPSSQAASNPSKLAQELMDNYVAVQKRWLALLTRSNG